MSELKEFKLGSIVEPLPNKESFEGVNSYLEHYSLMLGKRYQIVKMEPCSPGNTKACIGCNGRPTIIDDSGKALRICGLGAPHKAFKVIYQEWDE